jgi:hypothetical protein
MTISEERDQIILDLVAVLRRLGRARRLMSRNERYWQKSPAT